MSSLPVMTSAALTKPQFFNVTTSSGAVLDQNIEVSAPTLDVSLYQSKAAAKMHTAKVAMRIGDEWKRGLYHQLDSLMDIEEWEIGDEPLSIGSFATFLRLMFLLRPNSRPGLGITEDGNLLAMWDVGGGRLTFECKSGDRVKWIFSEDFGNFRESAAGETIIDRVQEILTPYSAKGWFRSECD